MYQVNLSESELDTAMCVLAGRMHGLRDKSPEVAANEYAAQIEVVYNKLYDVMQPHLNLSDQAIAKTCRVMRTYGGHFCQHLADMYGVADSANRTTLLMAFAPMFKKYGPDSSFYKEMK